jgi:hypothetical protein
MQRADPRQQLVEPEGLGQVVIRTGVEAPNHVFHRIP